MNQIQKLFADKKKNILSIYFTAGFPHLSDTEEILSSLQEYGAALIEIGMPYSDPLADGPVIQDSSMKALENGMSIKILFDQLNNFHKKANSNTKQVPLILMGYLNPVLQYGVEKFCMDAKKAGISGIILPDLPMAEFEKEYKKFFDENNLSFIFLITPETSEERIRKIDDLSNGFIYAVSSSSITGRDIDMQSHENYFKRIKNLKLKNHLLIGFGIKDRLTFTQACKYASGAIIGTAYINALKSNKNIKDATEKFLNSILQGE